MPEDPKLVDELQKMEYEPLNSAEKVLILTSLGLGLGLLVVFVILTRLWPALHS
ncbi:MAG TPA: hypothetical protein PKG54_10890 [Phycisphaerae bacterium]|jgi:hypothetical protein|nr:hypothetical protein [Phycisphaerae bacterium]HOB75022.1 hypothetical protein [Phycisphaerae bacterium]HOJ54843.1 hypothetical protein [Phycisphaerae bacterium]HOL26879.1 hypothetical protein [Phycisphaerae bacterium]HPP20834.1 hypothetical protein [Phycisphaerae bacterium]